MTLRPKALLATLCLLMAATVLSGCATLLEHNDSEGLKGLLGTPLALLVLMYVATFVNGLKQTSSAQADVGIGRYFFGHWRETAAMVFGNLLAFVALLAGNQLDADAPLGLKVAAALAIGYGINSLADKVTKTSTGRSADLANVEANGVNPKVTKEKQS